MSTAAPRALSDRCPGLLRPHPAEDGALVRLRIPAGRIGSAQLLALSAVSADLGEGSVQLTSRGNLQLRGIDESRLPELVDRVAGLGLLPSETHERVRNIVASPLAGLPGQGPDLRGLATELDAALCARPELAELPGRFLFALDDGSGDVSSLASDLAYLATGPATGVVLVGDRGHGRPVTRHDAVPVLLDLASRFVAGRAQLGRAPWHVRELPGFVTAESSPVELPAPGRRSVPLGAVSGAASVAVPLGLLDRGQVAALAAAAEGGSLVVTPWRGVVVPGAAAALSDLVAAGLVADERSPWSAVTACIGAPGCAKSAVSTRDLATELVRRLPATPSLPVHLTGCARRCGAPTGAHVDLVAPTSAAAALTEIAHAQIAHAQIAQAQIALAS